MANNIFLPYCNPYNFVVKDLAYDFFNKHLDVSLFQNQIAPFQQKQVYYQKVHVQDNIYFQINSNFGQPAVRLIDCEENIITNGVVAPIVNNLYNVPNTMYGCTIDTSAVPNGYYYILVLIGNSPNTTYLLSEPIEIIDYSDTTAIIEYWHDKNIRGTIYQNQEKFKLRVEALLTDFQPQSDDTIYADQNNNLVMLSSFPYRTWKLVIGNAKGVPNWVADKMNHILGLDNVFIDGKKFTKNIGAKLEPNRDRLTAMGGWTVELREAYSRNGNTISNDIPQQNKLLVEYIIDEKMFGNPSPLIIQKAE